MPDYVVDRVVKMLNGERKPVNGSHIVALGLSYKANSSDWRESPSLGVVRGLRDLGAHVTVCDPVVAGTKSVPAEVTLTPLDAIREEVDLAIVLTAHDAFNWDWIARVFPLILDTKNALREYEFVGQRL